MVTGIVAMAFSMGSAFLMDQSRHETPRIPGPVFQLLSVAFATASFGALNFHSTIFVSLPLWTILMGLAGVAVACVRAVAAQHNRDVQKTMRPTRSSPAPRKAVLTIPHVVVSGLIALVMSFLGAMMLAWFVPLDPAPRALVATMLFPLIWLSMWTCIVLAPRPSEVYGKLIAGLFCLGVFAGLGFVGII